MNEYELEFVSEGVSVERCLEFVTRLNKAEELKQKAYQLLESARKHMALIQVTRHLKYTKIRSTGIWRAMTL